MAGWLKGWRLIVLACAAGAAALGFAWLTEPGKTHYRSFDPVKVGHAEADLWRAYYERRHLDLAVKLAFGNRRVFGLTRFTSIRAGIAAAEAARRFQLSTSREEARQALPPLVEYFRVIAEETGAPIDPQRAARLELEWWQERREDYGPEGYAPAVAAAAAYIYSVEPARLGGYARLRAEAMALRDSEADHVSEADWARITALLTQAYTELRAEVGAPDAAAQRRG